MRRSPLRRKRKKKSLIEKLHEKAWKTFSEFIRRKAKGVCYICQTRKDWREMDASHYIHGRLDYSEINIHCCCVRCNRYLHGNLGAYAERLLADYGQSALLELRQEANQIKKWEAWELEAIIEKYRKLIERL